MNDDGKLTLRQYLLFRTLEDMGEQVSMAGYLRAVEAVSNTALSHPDWELDARQKWQQWDQWIEDAVSPGRFGIGDQPQPFPGVLKKPSLDRWTRALPVPCPECGQPPQRFCFNQAPSHRAAGVAYATKNPHAARLRAART